MPATSKKKTSGQATSDKTKKTSNNGTASNSSSKGKSAKASSEASAKDRSSKSKSSTAAVATTSAKKSVRADSKKVTAKAVTASTSTTKGRSKPSGAKSTPSASKGSSKTSAARSAKSSRPQKKGIVGRVAEAVGSLLTGGERNVLGLLKEDHRRVDAYFKKVQAAEDANHEEVFTKIKVELDLHAHVEEVIFYPHLMEVGSEELKKIVREGLEEHTQVRRLLTELSKLNGTDKVFKAKLKVLMENVGHHVEEEEDEMFPLVEEELGDETLVTLAERIEKEKAKVGGKSGARAAKGGKS